MKDIAFTQGEEFKKIKVHSDLLPGGGPIYDLADIDVRYYGLIQKYEPKGPTSGKLHDKKNWLHNLTTSEQVKFIATASIELGNGISEEEFDDWYRKEASLHLSGLCDCVKIYLLTASSWIASWKDIRSPRVHSLNKVQATLLQNECPIESFERTASTWCRRRDSGAPDVASTSWVYWGTWWEGVNGDWRDGVVEEDHGRGEEDRKSYVQTCKELWRREILPLNFEYSLRSFSKHYPNEAIDIFYSTRWASDMTSLPLQILEDAGRRGADFRRVWYPLRRSDLSLEQAS